MQISAADSYDLKDKKGTISTLQQICSMALVTSELELFKRTMNLIAQLHMSFKNIKKALESFKKLRDAA